MLKPVTIISATLLLSACATKGGNPADPYESLNRKTFRFNQAFDATILKPIAKVYRSVLPAPVRSGINNVYNNVNMMPTVANDLLQAEWNYALKDTWRFVINSTLGIAGILDVAERCGLPAHSNDLGITLAKWGDKQSPYFVIPFLGPSTFRDGMGLMFDYTLFTPYPYLSPTLNTSLIGVRYVDLRSQMLDTEKLMNDALDKYTFMRDAYLQHRQYLIGGEQQSDASDRSLYVDDDNEKPEESVLPEKPEPENGKKSPYPLTTAKNDTHSPASA